jgi:hypothetical protein
MSAQKPESLDLLVAGTHLLGWHHDVPAGVRRVCRRAARSAQPAAAPRVAACTHNTNLAAAS